MTKTPREMSKNSELYQTDFYPWTIEQAKCLKDGTWDCLDISNLVEEIESLGKLQRQELRNRLGILLGHLLKWEFQPSHRSKSWLATIREQRRRIGDLLDSYPIEIVGGKARRGDDWHQK
jgi:hypothetical protein